MHTDGWGAYPAVAKRGYVHDCEVIGDPKSAAKKFPHVHRIFSLVQRLLERAFTSARTYAQIVTQAAALAA